MVQHYIPPDAPSPRLCLVVKVNDNQEYGFNLHAERGKGQFVGAVDPDSPAERAGLRTGDRIFAVNGEPIVGESHREVVTKIKSRPRQCELLVISEEGAQWYREHNIPIDTSLPNILKTCQADQEGSPSPRAAADIVPDNHAQGGLSVPMALRPRLCRLEKHSPIDEFGFNLHAERGKGHYIGTVDSGGIADKAGLETGQRIVGVNGTLVFPTTPHKEVVALIKREPLATELLVASESVDRWYTDQGIPYSFDTAEVYCTKGSKSSRAPSEAAKSANSEHSKPNGSVPHSRHDTMEQKVAVTEVTQRYTHPEKEAVDEHNHDDVSPLAEEASYAVVTEASADDLLDQVFSGLKPPATEDEAYKASNGGSHDDANVDADTEN
ncbi:Protein NRFL-1 a, partial [Aphelenchoides avenae]